MRFNLRQEFRWLRTWGISQSASPGATGVEGSGQEAQQENAGV